MTLPARQVDMTTTMTRIIQMANTIFLRARPVVYLVQKMLFGQQRQGTKQCGTVNSRKQRFQVSQAESVSQFMTHLTPNEQADRR